MSFFQANEDAEEPNHETTYLPKYVPYLMFHKDKKLDDYPVDDDDDDLIEFQKLVKLTRNEGDFGERARLVGPVLKVISITISNVKDRTWKGYTICGEISVMDDMNNIFYFFKSDDGEDVSSECSHLNLYCSSMAPLLGGTVNFSIYKKNNDKLDKLFEGHRDLDKHSTEDPVKGTSTLVFDGKDNYRVSILFTKTLFAGVARVKMFLYKLDPETHDDHGDDSEESFRVYGKITVGPAVCFDKPSSHPLKIINGQRIYLNKSRVMFPAPAYAPLEFKIELFADGDLIFDDILKIPPYLGRSSNWDREKYPCKDKRFSFIMQKECFIHQDFFRICTLEKKVNAKWNPDLLRIGQIMNPPELPGTLVEVFSVVFGGSQTLPSNSLRGTILVRDRHETGYIFARNVDCPDNFLSFEKFRMLTLAWPSRWIIEENFFMFLKFEDVEGDQVSSGHIRWRDLRISYATYTPYERRVCGYIQVEQDSFVAVHYSVFRNGKKALVSVKWTGPPCKVYGSVVARYSNHSYQSCFDRKYYQSIVFKRSPADALKLKGKGEIPLLKSHISAPSDCSGLTIHVNLDYSIEIGKIDYKRLMGRINEEFHCAANIYSRNSLSDLVLVCVEWK